ncbi:acyl-CoA dehydrogenase family protein [Thermocatellispora tengchongensis]|uniref:acyl-CoA dehydrogenase family protein n=1 Tax=Thermocatellispora tengchongensis TaxID=1073253 RepID=UPI00362ECA0E
MRAAGGRGGVRGAGGGAVAAALPADGGAGGRGGHDGRGRGRAAPPAAADRRGGGHRDRHPARRGGSDLRGRHAERRRAVHAGRRDRARVRGGVLVEAEPTRRTPLVPLDQTRPLCALAFDRAPARVAGDGGRAAWERVRDAGLAALAAEQVGGAAACLAASVAHAKRRHQFGRPIGSFQAIQHKLADVLLLVESARSAAYAAARATPEDLPVAAAIAGSYCAEAYATAAGENIQVHGGIGITWEHDAHRHLKRATTAARLFGPPQAHRARLAPTAGL